MKIFVNKPNNAQFFLNGEALVFKKINGLNVCEKNVTGNFELRIVRIPETLFPLWFLRAFLFWIIGIAGIFTPWYDGKGAVLDYRLSADAGANCEMRVNMIFPKNKSAYSRAVFLEATDIAVYSEENTAFVKDKKAVKRKRLYSLFSWLARIAIVALTVMLIIM